MLPVQPALPIRNDDAYRVGRRRVGARDTNEPDDDLAGVGHGEQCELAGGGVVVAQRHEIGERDLADDLAASVETAERAPLRVDDRHRVRSRAGVTGEQHRDVEGTRRGVFGKRAVEDRGASGAGLRAEDAPDGRREGIAAHRGAAELVEAACVGLTVGTIGRGRGPFTDTREPVARVVEQEVPDAVGERLAERVAEPGLCQLDRPVVDDLLREARHARRQRGRRRGGDRPGLAEQAERCAAQVVGQRAGFFRQHERIG